MKKFQPARWRLKDWRESIAADSACSADCFGGLDILVSLHACELHRAPGETLSRSKQFGDLFRGWRDW